MSILRRIFLASVLFGELICILKDLKVNADIETSLYFNLYLKVNYL